MLSLILRVSLAVALPGTSSTFATEPAAKPSNPAAPTPPHVQTLPVMLEADGRLRFDFSEEKVVLEGGLQPFVFCTRSGALVVQAQLPKNPFPSKRMAYPRMLGTTISRDHAKSWTILPLPVRNVKSGAFLRKA